MHTYFASTPCPEKKSLEYFRHTFIKFFHYYNLQKICNKAVVKYLTTPQTRHYTTL